MLEIKVEKIAVSITDGLLPRFRIYGDHGNNWTIVSILTILG